MNTTTYSKYVSCTWTHEHANTTYSKYVMSHWTQQPTVNMSVDTTTYVCHATWTQQPTVNMSCHMDTTTYSKYVMPHGHNNLQ